MSVSLTAGAIRALELAVLLARQQDKSDIEPFHVLWALVLQESRAAEILSAHQLNAEQLAQLRPQPAGGFHPDLMELAASLHIHPQSDPPAHLTQQGLVQNMLRAVQSQLLTGLIQAEIGTEHLLFGLLIADPGLATELQEFGLTHEFFRSSFAEESIQLPEIKVDLRLHQQDGREAEFQATFRIIDAAANRAREGLRVLEDYVRFSLDDEHLSRRLKTWRHQLSHALSRIAPHQLLTARETEHDVGTQIKTLTETSRASARDVLRANFKRVQEATRTLEEFSKILSGEMGEQIGQLRYDIYTLEKAVLQTEFARERLSGRNVYLLVTEELCHHGSGPALRGAMQGGVRIVQLREKNMHDRELVAKGRRIREWTREFDTLFIMNDRPDMAVLTDADGVHVGQEEFTVKDARRIVGPDKLVGVSTHNIEQARQAVLDGADYIGVGPVFPTTTKHFEAYAGLEFVKQVAAEIRLPFFAIGGINQNNALKVAEAGASGIAVSSAICGAADPQAATRELMVAMAR